MNGVRHVGIVGVSAEGAALPHDLRRERGAARAALAGRQDRVATCGIDRWLSSS